MKTIRAYQASDEQWYIQIANALNGKIIGTGHEGYVSKGNATRAIKDNWKDGYTFKRVSHTPTSVTYRMVPRVA
jgi:uncharacterized protein YegP (UPF0339 family)